MTNTPTNGSPSRPITAPKPPRPPVIPRPKPRRIHDAERAEAEARLDAAIERIQPLIARTDAFWRAQGIDPVSMLCSRKALSIWSDGRMAPINHMPRKFFL